LRRVVICILLDKDGSQKLADSYLTFGKWDQEVVLSFELDKTYIHTDIFEL